MPAARERSTGVRGLRVADLPEMRFSAGAGRRTGHWLSVFLLLIPTACSSRAPQQPSNGIAFVGPITLNIRKDLASKSQTVATVRHGDKLDVLELRRRFIKVRTGQGIEGWTDSNLLLTDQQMGDLRHLAEGASKLASQGKATPFDVLNMHSAPARQSPSFFQIAENEPVEVIGHVLAPHVAPPEPTQAPIASKRPAPPRKSKAKAKDTQAPPVPSPPPPPRNWKELSKPKAADLASARQAVQAAAAAALVQQFDDWDLIRTRDGKVGWVLARMLTMSIPDEVAQYAEGHRITAYLALGEVQDKEKDKKHNWLWTTSSAGQHPYEFDSFRVFVWSTKRHHYETAYIERNVQGFYPVEAAPLPGQEEKAFSVVLREKDGTLCKRTYGFSGYHVRMISKIPYTPPPALPEVRTSRNFDPPPPPVQEPGGIGEKLSGLKKKWFGR
jgi:SH3-like domain-containing protein